MKIKFKQTRTPHISNITFNFNLFKLKPNKQIKDEKFRSQLKTVNSNEYQNFICHRKLLSNVENNKNSCLFLKSTGFIPKNSNIKSSVNCLDRQPRPIKSLQPAKWKLKNFPVRKVLSKRATLTSFIKKDINCNFANAQSQSQFFDNKTNNSTMYRSQSLFHSKKQIKNDSLKTSHQKHRRAGSFQRYYIENPIESNTVNLIWKQKDSKIEYKNSKTQTLIFQ